MLNINWKLRFKNKTTLISLITLIIGFVYQILSMFEVTPSISENDVTNIILMIVNILVAFGVVVDPTTAGVNDSKQALNYNVPKE